MAISRGIEIGRLSRFMIDKDVRVTSALGFGRAERCGLSLDMTSSSRQSDVRLNCSILAQVYFQDGILVQRGKRTRRQSASLGEIPSCIYPSVGQCSQQ